ncbi:MAG: hypothetical protein IJ599_00020 [Alphaproteobacteria bacterium]|nr:hypothetical protein [Alphaproteobacteria bacterium]
MRKAINGKDILLEFISEGMSDYEDYKCNVICLKWKEGGHFYTYPIYYCHWCGKEFPFAFEYNMYFDLLDASGKDDVDLPPDFCAEDIRTIEKIPRKLRYVISRKRYDEKLQIQRRQHLGWHYCDWAYYALDHEPPVFVYPVVRLWVLVPNMDMTIDELIDCRDNIPPENAIPIDYCCMCGARLPEKLDKKWSTELQNTYGRELLWRAYQSGNIPFEFRTEEWWRKRGL